MTALHWAAKKGFASVVEFLLLNGANVDAKDIVFQIYLRFPNFI